MHQRQRRYTLCTWLMCITATNESICESIHDEQKKVYALAGKKVAAPAPAYKIKTKATIKQ